MRCDTAEVEIQKRPRTESRDIAAISSRRSWTLSHSHTFRLPFHHSIGPFPFEARRLPTSTMATPCGNSPYTGP